MPAQGHILDADTIAIWRFAEPSGSLATDLAQGFVLSAANNAPVTIGRIDNCRGFNGTNQYLEGAANPTTITDFYGDITYELWIWIDPSCGDCSILSLGGQNQAIQNNYMLYEFGLNASQRMYTRWTNSGGDKISTFGAPATPIRGKWMHLAVRKWSQGGGLFTTEALINGAVVGLTADMTGNQSPDGLNDIFALGRYPGQATKFFKGYVDDIRISRKKRTDGEIMASYLRGLPQDGPRLVLDTSLIGYWGFDEAGASDLVYDESIGGNHIIVTGSPGSVVGRVGNGRSFDGINTFGVPLASTIYNILGNLTITAWVNMTDVNSTGSLLRTVMACDGPTTSDNMLYAVQVDNNGSLVYRHDSASGVVVVKTPPGTVRGAQTHNLTMTRTTNIGGTQTIEISVDNRVQTLIVTVNGIASAQPVPPPLANTSATLNFGRSLKESDQAKWNGFLDEISLHEVVRPHQPYLISAYYQAALKNTTAKISTIDTVLDCTAYEMGRGIRWWTYEREKDIYVVRESPFGQFSREVRLTTNGANVISGATKPSIVYDPDTDTLIVFFIVGNRIFKLSALSNDVPVTQNMPLTADAGGVIKSLDNVDAIRAGGGGGQDLNQGIEVRPAIGTIEFVAAPDFGVAVPNSGFTIALFRIYGGVEMEIARSSTVHPLLGYFFFPIPRLYNATYFARPVRTDGHLGATFSNLITDFSGEPIELDTLIRIGVYGDTPDPGSFGAGSGFIYPDLITMVNRTPVKFSGSDDPAYDLGGGAGHDPSWPDRVTYINRTPIKLNMSDEPAYDVGGGAGQRLFISTVRNTVTITVTP